MKCFPKGNNHSEGRPAIYTPGDFGYNEITETEVGMDRLKGSLEHIVFHNEKNGYTVADFDVDGKMVTVVGTMESPQMGIFLAMEGIWREHPTYGHQFQMENYRIDLPTSEEGLVRYLSSGLLPGIGEKIALEIVQTFDDKTMDVLDHHPKALL